MLKSIFNLAFIAIMLLGISSNAFGQKKSKEELMKQSNWQTTAGSILVLGGLTASTAGSLLVLGQEKGDTGGQLFAWGLVTALVGTPILTIGIINRYRANRISFTNEPIQNHVGNIPMSVPSLTLSIPI